MAQNASSNFLKRLRGSILDDNDVKGFFYEIDIAIHFVNQDYDVTFTDLEGIGAYDLLAAKGKLQIEIEYKERASMRAKKSKRLNFIVLRMSYLPVSRTRANALLF